MSTLNGGKSASTVGAAKVKIFGEGKFGGGGVGDRMGGKGRDDTGGGGGQGSASEKRKLQPVSAASVNARLLQVREMCLWNYPSQRNVAQPML